MDEMFDMMENGPADFNDRFGGYDPMDPNSQPQNMTPSQRVPGSPGPPLGQGNPAMEEALRNYMERMLPPMDDAQIQIERPHGFPQGHGQTIDPSAGPRVPFASPDWPTDFRGMNPNLSFDDTMDPAFEADPEFVMPNPELAEQMVQQMIHQNLNNRKFR